MGHVRIDGGLGGRGARKMARLPLMVARCSCRENAAQLCTGRSVVMEFPRRALLTLRGVPARSQHTVCCLPVTLTIRLRSPCSSFWPLTENSRRRNASSARWGAALGTMAPRGLAKICTLLIVAAAQLVVRVRARHRGLQAGAEAGSRRARVCQRLDVSTRSRRAR